jgi:hypothetical protein
VSIESIVASGRRLVASTFLDRARLQERLATRDASGGKQEEFSEWSRSFSCRFVRPVDSDPIFTLDSVFGRSEMTLLMPLGTDFAEGWRVRNLRDDKVWQIVKDLTPPSEMQTVIRVGIKAV